MRSQSRPSPGSKRRNDLQQLKTVDGAAPKFIIDFNVVGDWCRRGKTGDVVGASVNAPKVVVVVCPVAQRLNAPGCGAGSDRDESPSLSPNFLDSFHIMGRGDRTFHENDVIWTFSDVTTGLQKVCNVHNACNGQQFVLAIQKRELTTIARGEFENAKARSF